MREKDDKFYLLRQKHLLCWTPDGYSKKEKFYDLDVFVLTPKSIVKTFAAGYLPAAHPSAKLLLV